MKNKVLQISSWLILALTLAVVSAQAQTYTRYAAQIPFDFSIGSQNYQAGEYVIEMRNQTSVAQWSLKDNEGRNLKLMTLLMNGERSHGGKTNLLFNRLENQYFLTNMVAPEFGLRISKPKVRRELAKNFNRQNSRPETVAIILTKANKNVE